MRDLTHERKRRIAAEREVERLRDGLRRIAEKQTVAVAVVISLIGVEGFFIGFACGTAVGGWLFSGQRR